MWGVVFGLAAVLTLAVLLLPVARRSNIPYTVLLAVAGIALGFAAQHLGVGAVEAAHAPVEHGGAHGGGPIWMQIAEAIGGLRITSDVILFLFLPALVFESAMSLDLRKLMADMRSILFLAVVGVLISTAIVGLSIWAISGMALVLCLLLGAILSATDPVAVIALFKDLNAPKRLTVLVEGESLFNDATAIVISSIFIAMLAEGTSPDVAASALDFLVVFLGGVAVGVVVARPAIWLMRAFRRDTMIILTLTVTLPFVAFVAAEHFLHVSGVMAVVAAGLTIGSIGRRMIPPQVFVEVEHAWHQLGFWATSLIFMLVGLAIPRMLGPHVLDYVDDIVIVVVAATAARAFILYVLLPLLDRFGAQQKVSLGYQTIMFWGGLRGAVSLALALIVLETQAIPTEGRAFVGVLVTSYVLFTLLFQATTIHAVMRVFGLDKLSPADQALRDRSVASALNSVSAELDRFAEFHDFDEAERAAALKRFETAAEEAQRKSAAGDLSPDDWVRTGLAMALAQERQMYLTRFGEGFTTTTQLQDALARLDDIVDELKDGPFNWREAALKGVAYRKRFRMALEAQRNFGITRPLATLLSRRLGVLEFIRQVLREQKEKGIGEIEALLPLNARERFQQYFDERFNIVSQNAEALAVQYPDYAAALHRRDLALAGLRLEEDAYDRLLDQSIIGPEIHGDLVKRLESAGASEGRLPPLKLKLNTADLVARVPFFDELDKGRQKRIARLLKTRLFAPGDRIITRGEIGDEMFFIADGAVRVMLDDREVTLGTGDFFGEIALITDQPRNADVEALGFSTLLALKRRDFARFVKRHPDLRDKIRKIAAERVNGGVAIDL
ncbi:cation:proton antiporter [Hyphococcus luteus]|uniref:Sodium:proton antiporter n=1 Tax=Hyphococcus luteus TaxID=2058213 RepID=A0A2S7K336_9PROT|nr:cation:proton antiporter [Marinicaulis flavus]PQA86858.1 sodium:proton antiporter [Marinicaulis flavus]